MSNEWVVPRKETSMSKPLQRRTAILAVIASGRCITHLNRLDFPLWLADRDQHRGAVRKAVWPLAPSRPRLRLVVT